MADQRYALPAFGFLLRTWATKKVQFPHPQQTPAATTMEKIGDIKAMTSMFQMSRSFQN